MNKQISRGVLLSFIAQGIAILVNLVYTPMMVRVLGQNEYGLYQVVQSVVNYLNLMNFGFTSAYISFYSREKAGENPEEGVARLTQSALDYADEHGVEIIEFSDADYETIFAQCEQIAEDHVQALNDQGIDGDAIFARAREVVEKYAG